MCALRRTTRLYSNILLSLHPLRPELSEAFDLAKYHKPPPEVFTLSPFPRSIFFNQNPKTLPVTLTPHRAGESASTGLTEALRDLGFETGRLKTGTPPRVDARTLNYDVLEAQPGGDAA